MNQWDYVIASYAIGIGGTVGLSLWTWWQLRRAEKRLDDIRRR